MSEGLPDDELARLRKRAERERRARQEAEALAENGTRLLYERQEQLQLLYVIADAANKAISFEAAMQVALDAICAYTSWPIGHAYLVTDDPMRPLAPTMLWHLDEPEQFTQFRRLTENTSFRVGEGLPGRVLESGGTVWVVDVTEDENFPRAKAGYEIGVRGAFAIPVLAGKIVVAVLEFFSRETANPDEAWLEIAAQVGTQVGRTFEREARIEADRANRAKSEFLSRMSHELRTPLNAILGFGQLLEMDDLSREQRESVGFIMKGGRHLLNLINEILDISRIEAGQMHLSPEPVRVGDVLTEAIFMVRPLAEQRNIPVIGEIASACPSYVRADSQRLKQVILNLLSNAIKYNRAGGSVSVGVDEKSGRARISVNDTGAGIAEERLKQLFIPFERLGADRGPVEGTGLGLALSKRLTELMGGTIGVESVPGQGSTFWVELAMAEPPPEVDHEGGGEPEPKASETVSPTRRTILYIEDNPSNVQLVERILSRRPQFKLLVAMQAGLGLELARQHDIDLILLDLNLPDMTGQDALARLRIDPKTSAIPVVVLSADATSGQMDRMMAAGAVDYLTKPLEMSKFMRILDDVLVGNGVRPNG